MTNKSESGARRDPANAVVLAVALMAVISSEAMCLENLWKRDEEARRANDQLEASNLQTERYIAELRSAAQKIRATFTRLNDGIIRVDKIEGRLPTPGRNPRVMPEYADSRVAKSLRENGFTVKPLQEGHREPSVSFEVGSNHLELHRLLPFLAEQENSNAFLFIDKLDLVKPVEIPAFSMNPTGLETRVLIRVLSGPK